MKAENPKTIARNFLRMVTSGQTEAAFKKYVDMQGVHHNTFTPAGFAALLAGMRDNDIEAPHKQLTIKHLVHEGDMVVAHSQLVMKPGEKGMIVVHLFRIVDGKIVESWDCGQVIEDDTINRDGAF